MNSIARDARRLVILAAVVIALAGMSIRAMNWAWEVLLPPAAKLVLLALADIADDAGSCWPSQHVLAAKCSITSRTVQRIIVTLQSQDLLVIEPRYRADGSRSSNRYRLPLDTPHDKLSGEGDSGVQGDTTPVSWGGDTGVVARTTNEPSIESPQPTTRRNELLKTGSDGLIFPTVLSPAQCRTLCSHLADLGNTQAQQVIDELAGRMEVAKVRDPIGYCATLIKRLRHGQFEPRLALKVDARRRLENARTQVSVQIDPATSAALGDGASRLPTALAATLRRIRLHISAAAGETDGDRDERN